MDTYTSQQQLQIARSAITNGHLNRAFEKVEDFITLFTEQEIGNGQLKEIQNEFIVLSRSNKSNNKDENLGLYDKKVTEANRTKISRTLLHIIDDLNKFIDEQNSHINLQIRHQVVIVLDINKENFDQAEFLNDLSLFLKSNTFKIKKVDFGSVIITLDLSNFGKEELQKVVKIGDLDRWKVSKFEDQVKYEIDPKILEITISRSINYGLIGDIVDLSRVNLDKTDLRNVNLSKVKMRGASIRFSNLQLSNLRETNLNRSDLRESSLSKADLRKCDFFKADLRKVNLFGAQLKEADLFEADLSEARAMKADLTFADLGGAILCKADLSEANLQGANLLKANLSDANLRKANLTKALLWKANLSGIDFREAQLNGAIFHISQKDQISSLGIDTTIVEFVGNENQHKEIEVAPT